MIETALTSWPLAAVIIVAMGILAAVYFFERSKRD